MRWEEITLEKGIWRLPSKEEYQPQRTKNGEEHFVDLSPQAVTILDALPGARAGLCSPRPEGHRSAASQKSRSGLMRS